MSDTVDTLNDGADSSVTETKPPSDNLQSVGELRDFAAEGYRTHADGTPILGLNGQPKKKPGRKLSGANTATISPPSDTSTAAPVSSNQSKTPTERKAQQAASEELARAILNVVVGSMSSVVGNEWQFQSQEEADGMKSALSLYINAKGDGKLSPEAMLLLVVAGYSLPRMAHENTRSKFSVFFSGCFKAIKGVFSRSK